jgi:hypothetical protein
MTWSVWNSKKAMKGVGLGLRFRVEYYLCWVPRQGILAWAGGKSHKIILDMGPRDVTNYVNVMSYTLHGSFTMVIR